MNKEIEVPQTLLDIHRVSSIMSLLVQTRHLEGDIAEVGVYRGGVAYYLDKLSHGKKVFLFDTFEGIPMKGKYDRHDVGDFSDTNFDEVADLFKESPKTYVIRGVFPRDTPNSVLVLMNKFSFVHLDADQYESTLDCLKFFYDKMSVGGVIVCDDYKFLDGVDAAISEFLSDKPEREIQTANMQCIIIKQ